MNAEDGGHKSEEPDVLLDGEAEGRYSRFNLIAWWDQKLLQRSQVMVVGAGALGNEIVKDLALLGVGNLYIIDSDIVESSNLSRSVLYRESDRGKPKAYTAAKAAKEINPDIKAIAFSGDIIHDIGLGLFRAMDVVICGLDNREARLWVNQCCWKVNKPWVDGAIDVLNGVARVFVPPDSACYECTMNAADRRLLNMRKSCTLLASEQVLQGRTPTTPTTASVIAGIQCQEAIKLLHKREDLPVLAGKGFFFNGLSHDSFVIEYSRREDCMSHETYEPVIEMPWKSENTTIRCILEKARQDLGPEAVLEFSREIVCGLTCEKCGTVENLFKTIGKLTKKEAVCPLCGTMRTPELTHQICGDEQFLDFTLSDTGIPPYDIIAARSGTNEAFYEMSGDKDSFLALLK